MNVKERERNRNKIKVKKTTALFKQIFFCPIEFLTSN